MSQDSLPSKPVQLASSARSVGLLSITLVGLILMGALFGPLIHVALIVLAAAALFALTIFVKPVWGFYLLIVSLFSLHWLTDSLQILPKPFNFLPDFLALIVFLRGLDVRIRRTKSLPRTPIDGWVLLFIGLATLSALLNRSDSVIVFFNGLFRQNLKFILIFYAIVYLAPPEPVLRRLVLLIIGLELLQIPVTIVQALHYTNWDLVGGTLGAASTGILTLSTLMVMCLLFGLSQAYRKILFGFLGLALFIPAVVGEGKIAFLLGPVMILFLVAYRLALFRLRVILLVIFFVFSYLLALVALQYLLPDARSLDVLSSINFTLRTYERPLSATGGFPRSRLGDIQFTIELLQADAGKALFGYGPGSSSHAFAEFANGSLYRRFQDFEGPYFYFSFVQLSTTALEYGYVGLCAALLTLWWLYRYNQRFLAHKPDKFWWAVAWGFRGVVFVYVTSMPYWRVWNTEILASIFWILAGCIVAQARRAHVPTHVHFKTQTSLLPQEAANS